MMYMQTSIRRTLWEYLKPSVLAKIRFIEDRLTGLDGIGSTRTVHMKGFILSKFGLSKLTCIHSDRSLFRFSRNVR